MSDIEHTQADAEDGPHTVHTVSLPFGDGTLHVETETVTNTPRLRIIDETHGIVIALKLDGGHWQLAKHPAVMGA